MKDAAKSSCFSLLCLILFFRASSLSYVTLYTNAQTFDYILYKVVTYHFIKSFSVAYVTNTQYCRLEGDSRCVISMNVETDGVTFGDTFTVVIRWVATRVGKKDLQVQVGLHVNFKKSTM